MGYSALLFCPEEKTARTVTQVLSELEFTVEACTEPFAAVKKLMGQHFDAVVVDCDNEQNATLLFKSARNSTSNQTSLAVAVVEGQAGVAKAFRIGANLVLTKPINIEQSKGTLRVARGLLRKGEPVKPAPAATNGGPTAPVPKPVAPKTISEPKPRPVVAASTSPLVPEPAHLPAPKPIPAWPAAAIASTKPPAPDDDLLDIDSEEPKKTAAANQSHPAMNLFEQAPTMAPKIGASGAASAPAPAREPAEPIKPSVQAGIPVAPEIIESAPASIVGSAPSFNFGGMTGGEEESSGGRKKFVIGIAAAAVVALGIYFGVSHFRGSSSESAGVDTASVPASAPQSAASTPKPTAQPEKPSATSIPSSQSNAPEAANKIQSIIDETAGDRHSTREIASKSLPESAEDSAPEPKPLVVKAGKFSTHPKATAETSAPAPSMIGLATPGATAPPAGLVPTATPSLRPMLSTVNVSQGVSTGLLIKKVAPSYPANALRMRIEGNVELQATISKGGDITHIKVVSGNSQLTKAATDAVKQWKYKPYLLNGEPVEIQTQVTVKFKLPD